MMPLVPRAGGRVVNGAEGDPDKRDSSAARMLTCCVPGPMFNPERFGAIDRLIEVYRNEPRNVLVQGASS